MYNILISVKLITLHSNCYIGSMDTCKVCNKEVKNNAYTIKSPKGLKTLQDAVKLKGDNITFVLNDILHSSCRISYAHKRNISAIVNDEKVKKRQCVSKTRSTNTFTSFDYRTMCLFCGVLLATRIVEQVCHYSLYYAIKKWNREFSPTLFLPKANRLVGNSQSWSESKNEYCIHKYFFTKKCRLTLEQIQFIKHSTKDCHMAWQCPLPPNSTFSAIM